MSDKDKCRRKSTFCLTVIGCSACLFSLELRGLIQGQEVTCLLVGSAMRGQWIPTTSPVINRTMLPTVTQHANSL